MKTKSIFISILLSCILLIGCGGKSPETKPDSNSSETETKVDEKKDEKEKDNKKVDKDLQKLQPGQFKSELAKSIDSYEFTSYDDLLRYPEENKDKKVKVMGTVQQVDFADDGAIEVFLYDNANDRYYFVYYFKDIVNENVVVGDYITALCKMENITEISGTNAFGVEAKTNAPVLQIDYLLNDSYAKSLKAIGEFLGTENKYDFELVGEAKDFNDLEGKKGYVFALKSKDDGTYNKEYIFAEKNILRYYTPTIDGKNINGDSTSLSDKSVYGAQ